jgi:hypothetical protein
MSTFRERNEFGEKAETLISEIMSKNGIPCAHVIEPAEWSKYDSDAFAYVNPEYQKLQRIALECGDRIISDKLYRCEIKRGGISVKSKDGFKGNYFILCNAGLTECVVIESYVIRSITSKSYATLRSGDDGFEFERLKHLPHMTLNEFIKKCKE